MQISPNVYSASCTLEGHEAEFSVSLRIEQLDLLKQFVDDVENEEVPIIRMQVSFSFKETAGASAGLQALQEEDISIWSDSVLDLLDLSICLTHFAKREDTTERLLEPVRAGEFVAEVSKKPYSHRALWILSQSFLDCQIHMFSKNTPRFQGMRFIDIVLYNLPDECQTTIVSLSASPESLLLFADRLYQIHNEIQTLLGAKQ